MKTDERIIKYLENELAPEEKTAFEEDLKNSVELKEEFQKYLAVKEEIEHLKNTRLNSLYVDSILPEFRNRVDTRKKVIVKKSLGYAFGVMLIFIVSIVVLKIYFNHQRDLSDIEEFTQSLDEDQKIELLDNINGDREVYSLMSENITVPDLVLLLETNLVVTDELAKAYDIEYKDMVSLLTEDEIEKIYNEVINKNFIEEVDL
jgi:hypothetical protein